jgi:hypothetical protein
VRKGGAERKRPWEQAPIRGREKAGFAGRKHCWEQASIREERKSRLRRKKSIAGSRRPLSSAQREARRLERTQRKRASFAGRKHCWEQAPIRGREK